ncbi:MAG: DUF3667 domain-containing protein [Chitinophagaceae bacterium]
MKSFFKTIGLLISKPGILSSEYMVGKREYYVRPIVLFIIVCGVFFSLFFIFFKNQNVIINTPSPRKMIINKTSATLREKYKEAKTKEDSAGIEQALKALNNGNHGKDTSDTDTDINEDNKTDADIAFFNQLDTTFKSMNAYDSAQKQLSVSSRDGKFLTMVKHVGYRLTELYGNSRARFWSDVLNRFLHWFPYILIVCFPFYVLLLRLFYIRRKGFDFTLHAVFLMHIYAFAFLLFLVFLGIISLRRLTEEERIWFTAFVAFFYLLIYLFRAMKRFYKQSTGKTLIKFIFFNLFCSILLVAIFIGCFGLLVLQK